KNPTLRRIDVNTGSWKRASVPCSSDGRPSAASSAAAVEAVRKSRRVVIVFPLLVGFECVRNDIFDTQVISPAAPYTAIADRHHAEGFRYCRASDESAIAIEHEEL